MSQTEKIPRIARLNSALINQIAAGEVIERPSSVVKELVENAVDSGATRITIHIERGGTEKILICDNGCGIHPDDLELAIKRHATSKLHDQEGLNAIRSLGFRGEALSSIASVSYFSIVSRIAAAEHASRIEFDPYSSEIKMSPASANIGTTVEVIKLFQPVPARRKFLRSPKTEYLHILEIIKRFAMCHCDIDIRLYHNGKQMLSCTPAIDDIGNRISTVLDRGFYKNAWYFEGNTDDMRVCGWLGNEKSTRNQSDRQYLFLNNRIIRDKHINHAIRMAMNPVVHESKYPSFIIYLEVDPVSVDVNVHPTKQEVRFKSPRVVHDFIYALISDAIRKSANTSSLSGSNDSTMEGDDEDEKKYRDSIMVREYSSKYADKELDLISINDNYYVLGKPIMVLPDNILVTKYNSDIRIIDFGNLRKQYLLTLLSEQALNTSITLRPLLVPVNIQLNDTQINFLVSNTGILLRQGFDITQSGPGSILVRSVPSLLPGLDIQLFIKDFMNNAMAGSDNKITVSTIVDSMVNNSTMTAPMSLEEVSTLLKRCHILDLPFSERDVKGYWRTISSGELKKIIGDGK